jgi:hypothetical protein
MKTKVMWLLLLLLSAQAAHVLAASGQIDPTKPGGPARDNTLGAPPPQSPSKTPSGEEKKGSRAERVQRISGVITSVTSIDLVLSQPQRKDKKTVRFVLRPDTVKEGDLRPGAQVTVEYQAEGDKNVAKRVRVQPQRAPRQR